MQSHPSYLEFVRANSFSPSKPWNSITVATTFSFGGRLIGCIACSIWAAFSLNAALAIEDQKSLHSFEVIKLTDVYFAEGANAGDLDGDGIPDVVYGPYWWKGPDYQERHEIYPPVPQNMEGYADHFFNWIHDFDGDGWSDIFVVGFPGTPGYVYQNPGPNGWTSHWKKHRVFDAVSNEAPVLKNIVGDDRPELICAFDGYFGFATIDWDNPFAKWQFHPISEKIAPVPFGHGLGVGDVNGDGLHDLLWSDGWFEQPKDNALSSRWQLHSHRFTTAYGGAEMYAYDVNGDGRNDIITSQAAHDFGLAWYEQVRDGDDIQFREQLIMGDRPEKSKYGLVFSELHSVALADVNGDGLLDILTGKTYYSHHRSSPMWDAGAVVYWFQLDRSGGEIDWIPFQAAADTGIGRQISMVDVNNDGLLDIVVGGMKGAHVLVHRVTEVDEAVWQAAQPKKFEASTKSALQTESLRLTNRGRVAGAVEGESFRIHSLTGGDAGPQDMSGFSRGRWSNQSQLWWTGGKPGDRLDLQFQVPDEGKYTIAAGFTKARDYGMAQVLIDGEPLTEPIDFFNYPDVIHTGLIRLGERSLREGNHTFSLKITGANPAALPAYMVGLDFILVRDEQGNAVRMTRSRDEQLSIQAETGVEPTLSFETGDLRGWSVEGNAFAKQPVRGDTVFARRKDMKSNHAGDFWIGSYEIDGDAVTGVMTSNPFKVTSPWGTFLVGGGSSPETRVEIVEAETNKVLLKANGRNVENMERAVVDLRSHVGKSIYIRIVDQSTGGWGHINFDDFRFHDDQPGEPTKSFVELVPDEYPFAGLAAEDAAKAMVLPDGFQAIVGASEPHVLQPIAMAIDDRGRVWIAEAYEYPVRAADGKGRDRILIFEDTNGDGRLDKRTVFTENLNLVSGLELGFGGVWIGAAPYLLFIPDRNRDDVPDGPPEVLLDGWGYQDTHETLNAFIWGPDGWLYGCHGVFTHSRVGKPGTPNEKRQPINAGIWRYHPTRHEFEVFAHGTSNPWGVDFNDHGQAFCTACVIPHLFHIIQGGRYNRQAGNHFNPYTYDDIKTIADHLHYLGANPHGGNNKSDQAGGGHAHAGAMIYLGGTWPEQYRNQIFMNNIHGQRLNVDLLEANGSGYVGKHGPDFLLTRDAASQILNLRYGPDGQAWMIDWYDMQACHLNDPAKHDRSNGRIYKIVFGQPKKVEVDLATWDDLRLARCVEETNDWYVRHARKLLQERAASRPIASAAIEYLRKVATTHADDTRRLRAIWALHVANALPSDFLAELFKDTSPYVRGWAIQLGCEQEQSLTPRLLSMLEAQAIGDDSPIVRLYLASAAQRLPSAKRWTILEGLIQHSQDKQDHNLPLMYWYAAEPLVDVDLGRALKFALQCSEHQPMVRDFLMRRIANSEGEGAIESLVAALGSTTEPQTLIAFLEAIRSALRGQRQVAQPKSWPAAFAALQRSDTHVRLQAASLGAVFGDPKAKSQLEDFARDTSLPPSARQEAATTLLTIRDAELASKLETWLDDSVLRVVALRGMADIELPNLAVAAVERYAQLESAERRQLIATLSSRKNYARTLLEAIESKHVAATDLPADLVRQMLAFGDAEIEKMLSSAWGMVRETEADKRQLIDEYSQLVQNDDLPAPDLTLGRAIFVKTCQQCHVLYGVGGQIGPDLTGSNRSNLEYLLSNIVDPSAVMAKEYQPTIFLTDGGRTIVGLIREENAKSITIQTSTELIDLPVDEVVDRKLSEKSMMPDDQLRPFSKHELRSLFAYLADKQQHPLLLTRDTAPLMFNRTDLTGWQGNSELWSVEDGQIVGRTKGLSVNEFLVSDVYATDFRLVLEVKLTPNSENSGIQFRSELLDHGDVKGYQADIGQGWWGKLYEEHGRGLLWEKSGEEFVKHNDWNRYEIVAKGHHIETFINGQKCVDIVDDHGATGGRFAIQLHAGGPMEIRVKNISIEPYSE